MPKISTARKDARRDEILAAAVRCFSRQGFQKTTIHDICAEASLSVGAIYSYFASKDAIIAALADAGRRATARLVDDDSAAAPIDRLRALLGEFQRAQDPTVYQLDVRTWGEAIGDERLREMTLGAQDGSGRPPSRAHRIAGDRAGARTADAGRAGRHRHRRL